jgi:hypothetical protein
MLRIDLRLSASELQLLAPGSEIVGQWPQQGCR